MQTPYESKTVRIIEIRIDTPVIFGIGQKEKKKGYIQRYMDKNSIRYHEYPLSNGFRILAGRSDIDNDALTFKMTRPNTWWFHVHGMPGSHVVLLSPDETLPDKDTLKVAAAVAAYHSKARNAGVVPVAGTQAQYIKKPRGAKAGTVSIRKETIFKVRPGLPSE